MGFKQSLALLASLSAGFIAPQALVAQEFEADAFSPEVPPAVSETRVADAQNADTLNPDPPSPGNTVDATTDTSVASLGSLSDEQALEDSRQFIENWLNATLEERNATPAVDGGIDGSVGSPANAVPTEEFGIDELEDGSASRVGTTEDSSQLGLLLGRNDGPASLYAHELRGQEAATVYLKGLPLLTFTTSSGSSETPTDMATRFTDRINQLAAGDPDSYEIGLTSGDRFAVTVDSDVVLDVDETVESVFRFRDRSATATLVANQMRQVLQGASPLDASDAVVVARASSDYFGAADYSGAATDSVASTQRGLASWYGPGFAGRLSANGEIFNPEHMTAAHKYLPFNTMVEVVNLITGSSVVVRINDRGPFVGERIIDLSAAAARSIGLMQSGVGPVEIRILN